MIKRKIYYFFAVFFIFSLEYSFISSLPAPFSGLELSLVFFIFILALSDFSTAFFYYGAVGFLFDLFYFSYFGLYFLVNIITAIGAYFILFKFFVNRSLYTFLVITAIISSTRQLIFLFFSSLLGGSAAMFFSHLTALSFWRELALNSAMNMAAALIIFVIVNKFTNHLKPVFLDKKFNAHQT